MPAPALELVRLDRIDPQHSNDARTRHQRHRENAGQPFSRCCCGVLKARLMAYVADGYWRAAQDRLVDTTFRYLDRAFCR